MVSQRSRTAKASHTPPRCHSERTVSFRTHSVIPRALCHSEGSEESKYLAPGLPSQILRCAQNDVDGQNDVDAQNDMDGQNDVAGGWMFHGC